MNNGTVGSLVEVDQVAVTIDETALLRPTSFALAAGDALAVTGANGSGKTTLLRVLSGQTRATAGGARVQGTAVDERAPRFRRLVSGSIGRPPVARDLTLEEHLALVAASWGAPVPDARARAAEQLERWELLSFRRRFPHELSSGQSQSFALALATVRPFELLLLDEPEQRLDPERLAVLIDVLRSELEAGRTVVFATHSPVLVAAVATRTLRLSGGGDSGEGSSGSSGGDSGGADSSSEGDAALPGDRA